jgi:hypothetical protein
MAVQRHCLAASAHTAKLSDNVANCLRAAVQCGAPVYTGPTVARFITGGAGSAAQRFNGLTVRRGQGRPNQAPRLSGLTSAELQRSGGAGGAPVGGRNGVTVGPCCGLGLRSGDTVRPCAGSPYEDRTACRSRTGLQNECTRSPASERHAGAAAAGGVFAGCVQRTQRAHRGVQRPLRGRCTLHHACVARRCTSMPGRCTSVVRHPVQLADHKTGRNSPSQAKLPDFDLSIEWDAISY